MRKFTRTIKIISSKRGRKIISYNIEIDEKLRSQEFAMNVLKSIFI
jgi:hypothetical protein